MNQKEKTNGKKYLVMIVIALLIGAAAVIFSCYSANKTEYISAKSQEYSVSEPITGVIQVVTQDGVKGTVVFQVPNSYQLVDIHNMSVDEIISGIKSGRLRPKEGLRKEGECWVMYDNPPKRVETSIKSQVQSYISSIELEDFDIEELEKNFPEARNLDFVVSEGGYDEAICTRAKADEMLVTEEYKEALRKIEEAQAGPRPI